MNDHHLITDKMLEDAGRQYCSALIDSLPSPDEWHHDFSDSFEQKMQPLIKKGRRQKALLRIRHAAASILIVLTTLFAVWMAVDIEARASVISWFKEQYENSFIYHYFFEETPHSDPGSYTITWVPDGYVLTRVESLSDTKVMEYTSDSSTILSMCYTTSKSDMYVSSHEGLHTESVDINGLRGNIYWSNENTLKDLVWIDENAGVAFYIQASEKIDTILGIAESIINEEG